MENDRSSDDLAKKQDDGESNYGSGQNDYRQSDVIGSEAMPPVFLGNLTSTYSADAITELFERPIQPSEKNNYFSIPVDRIDIKRGYCFVFLKDAKTQADKDNVEGFVMDINGMEVANVSQSLRAEFARGDGRVKKKEDERRRNIHPSETLFVVNFHEETTRQSDLQMLFEPYGELVRIDMKRNYAFVQFKTIAEAALAKEKTNGGKLDQSVLTVEFVARQRRHDDGRGPRDDRRRNDLGGGGGGRNDYTGRDYDRRREGGGGRGRVGGLHFDGRNGEDRRGYVDDGPSRYPDRYENGGGGRRNDYESRGPDRFDDRRRDGGGVRNDYMAKDRREFRSRSRSRERNEFPPHSNRGAPFDRRPDVRVASPPRNDYPPLRGPSPSPATRGRMSPPRDNFYRGDRDHRGYRH